MAHAKIIRKAFDRSELFLDPILTGEATVPCLSARFHIQAVRGAVIIVRDYRWMKKKRIKKMTGHRKSVLIQIFKIHGNIIDQSTLTSLIRIITQLTAKVNRLGQKCTFFCKQQINQINFCIFL